MERRQKAFQHVNKLISLYRLCMSIINSFQVASVCVWYLFEIHWALFSFIYIMLTESLPKKSSSNLILGHICVFASGKFITLGYCKNYELKWVWVRSYSKLIAFATIVTDASHPNKEYCMSGYNHICIFFNFESMNWCH